MAGVLYSIPDGVVHAAGVKSLAEQVAVHPSRHACLFDRRAVPQFSLQDLPDQDILVDPAEDFRDRRPRQFTVDAKRLDGTQHTLAAVAFHCRPGPGAGERGAAIIERAFVAQPLDRGVDRVRLEFAAGEPRPYLGLRQLAAGEQPEGSHVGVWHALIIW